MSVDDDLDRLLAGARADDAARSRAVVGNLREVAAEDATVLAVLVDLADRRGRARITARGLTIAGAVETVTAGGVVVTGPSTLSLVRLAAIDTVACPDGHRFDGDDRRVDRTPWIGLLQHCLVRDDDLAVTCTGVVTRGALRSIGRDVIGLVGADGAAIYVRTEGIDMVVTGRSRTTSS